MKQNWCVHSSSALLNFAYIRESEYELSHPYAEQNKNMTYLLSLD